MNAIEHLEKLVSIESTFEKEAKVADYLEVVLIGLGFSLDKKLKPNEQGQRNILATRGKSPKTCWYGHMDTVPVYEGWQTDPFVLTSKNGKLYGLGANDMKGGIAALLAALELLPKSLALKVIFCFDEEYDSLGAWQVATEYKEWFRGVTHIISLEAGTAEITDVLPKITLGRRGRARYQVSISGFSAHGGTTERGINAINIASMLVPLIDSAPMVTHPKLGIGSQFVASIKSDNLGLSVPDRCQLEIERHFVHPETVESVLQVYRSICNDVLRSVDLTNDQRKLVSVDIVPKPRQYPYMESYVTAEDDPLVQETISLMDQILSGHVVNYGRSVADDNIMANSIGCMVLVLGPQGGNEHSPDEWVSAHSLQQYSELYEAMLSKFQV